MPLASPLAKIDIFVSSNGGANCEIYGFTEGPKNAEIIVFCEEKHNILRFLETCREVTIPYCIFQKR